MFRKKKLDIDYLCLVFLQAGWRENQVTFMTELRNLHATGLSTLGSSLKEAFDLLNLYRLQSGIDNYGMVSEENTFCWKICLVVPQNKYTLEVCMLILYNDHVN